MKPSREVALLSIADIERGGYANLVLKNRLTPLTPTERGLVTVLVYGVIRHKTKLDAIIQKFSKTPVTKLSPVIHNILRMAIFQFLYLDRIPDFAIANEAVILAKKFSNIGASKFVNAVIREICKNTEPFVFDDWSVEFSHPQWMIDMWISDYGEEKTLEILKNNNEIGEVSVRGDVVQGASSQKAVEILAPKSGETIIDACSAPGGKSMYMAETMKNKGHILACDMHAHRVEIVKECAEKYGLSIIEPIVWDSSQINEKWLNIADKVLVDAPCSGLGVIHKKPDIKWSKNMQDVENLAKIQYEILSACANYVKPGGALMYCTCTVNKTENDNIIAHFLENNSNFKTTYSEQIFPSKTHDGFYIEKMQKD